MKLSLQNSFGVSSLVSRRALRELAALRALPVAFIFVDKGSIESDKRKIGHEKNWLKDVAALM